MSRRDHFLKTLVDGSGEGPALVTADGHRCVAQALEPAFDPAARNRGLLGRSGLAEGSALIIAPSWLIHTFRMQFAIDVIYASRDGRVLKLRRDLGPGRISGAIGAFAVIEMAAGSIDRAQLEVGDRLAIGPVPGARP